MYSMSRTYKTWDKAMSTRDPDYVKLYGQMALISRDPSLSRDIDFWWRFSAVTFGFTNSISPESQRSETQAKLKEAKQNAEKALKISPKHFIANLLMAKVLAEMMTLEGDLKKRRSLQGPLVKHLKECLAQQANLWQVILLECQVHIQLQNLVTKSKESTSSASAKSSIPLHSPSTLERKLRRILYFAGNSLETYLALVMSLHKQGKINEVLCISMYALKLERANPKEQYVAQTLERFREKVAAEKKKRK